MFDLLVFKFVEHPLNNEKPEKTGLKFKIMSMKVKGSIEYVPEMVSFFTNIMESGHNENKFCSVVYAWFHVLILFTIV